MGKFRRRWAVWALAIGAAIGSICLGIGRDAIIKVGGSYLEAAIERFMRGGAPIETGSIPQTPPAPPQPAAAEQPPCITESPAAIVAKLKKSPAWRRGACVSLTV